MQDASGAVITNAKLTLTNQAAGIVYEGTSNEQGICLISNLPPGTYRVLAESPSFRAYVLTSVPILSSNITDIEVTLQVGAVTQSVEVSAESVQLQTQRSASSTFVEQYWLRTKSGAASGKINMPLATPRLREYFPETLLWQPEILTDRSGNTRVKVPLADSITTWKVSVIASTLSTTAAASMSAGPARILVDGKPGPELSVSTDLRQLTPQRADLTAFLVPGRHTVNIQSGSTSPASVYVNTSYYLPWTDPSVSGSTVASGDAESVRYDVKFDRTSATVGDSIRCTVHAERVGFRGYGMVLAEVGVPPGAEVDRASLDAAIESAGWHIQSYEVQPDRVVFYVWPRAGGTNFSFTLKPRFAMSAASAESVLYDYYNPQARASVPPAHFVIAPGSQPTTAALPCDSHVPSAP